MSCSATNRIEIGGDLDDVPMANDEPGILLQVDLDVFGVHRERAGVQKNLGPPFANHGDLLRPLQVVIGFQHVLRRGLADHHQLLGGVTHYGGNSGDIDFQMNMAPLTPVHADRVDIRTISDMS